MNPQNLHFSLDAAEMASVNLSITYSSHKILNTNGD